MNKKLLAVAVAGAFVAPALVYAQNATVQVYGKATFEYGYADQGSGRRNTDIFQTPGGSNVGFKGQEQLGGGLSAWFQCESSADIRGLNADGFCSRNSALGLKGGWGNAYFGTWQTPFTRSTVGMVGAGDTGLLGAAFTFSGNNTSTAACCAGGDSTINRLVWKRRERSTVNYESPSFSGFQVSAAYSTGNQATSATDATTSAKPRVGSIAGTYSNGPLNVGLAYEKHYNFGSVGGSNDDRAWTIGASYNFMGNLLVGFQYIDMKYESSSTSEVKKKNWFLGADWNFSGPHHVLAAYVNAGDTKGNATAAQFAAATNNLAGGNGAYASPGSDSGADWFEIMYGYDFSKRTSVKLGYVRLNNDTRAVYSLGGLATVSATGAAGPVTVGTNQSAWVMYGQHTW